MAGGDVLSTTSSGTTALALPLTVPFTTSASRLSPPQAGGGGTTVVDLFTATDGSAEMPAATFESAAPATATNLTPIALCALGGTLTDWSTAGRGGKDEACRSKAVMAAAAVL